MEQYNEDGSSFKRNGDKKPFINKIFELPYKTLDVYKTIKNRRSNEKDIINKVNQ